MTALTDADPEVLAAFRDAVMEQDRQQRMRDMRAKLRQAYG